MLDNFIKIGFIIINVLLSAGAFVHDVQGTTGDATVAKNVNVAPVQVDEPPVEENITIEDFDVLPENTTETTEETITEAPKEDINAEYDKQQLEEEPNEITTQEDVIEYTDETTNSSEVIELTETPATPVKPPQVNKTQVKQTTVNETKNSSTGKTGHEKQVTKPKEKKILKIAVTADKDGNIKLGPEYAGKKFLVQSVD